VTRAALAFAPIGHQANAPRTGSDGGSVTPAPAIDVRSRNNVAVDAGRAGVSTRSGEGEDDPADTPEGRERSRLHGRLDTCHVLVVDDDEIILAAVSGFLVQEGFNVETATNGSEALECVERARPHVVLLDMRMPVLDGWAFASALRERDIALRIVVMTAAQDARRWAEEIGAQAYLAKPFDLDDLIVIVQRACLDD
jgi:two-component system, chemotaxis family, chemotaxis protein CheY